jgi:hypothetical protein
MERKLIGATETPKLERGRDLVMYAVYTYMLDDYGPFTFEIPKSQDTPEALEAEMSRKEQLIQQTFKT